jgi:predicted RNA-binding Zn-ribbon protein involved in translation (DUF1610 family)
MTQPTRQTKTINCTSCGAGLSVLGGGRVRGHVCGYCGAVMDAHEGYKLVQQYKDMPRPNTPLEIGMTGQIHGADFTIIGTIGNVMYEDGEAYRWTDHQLYSPTHGYAWATWNPEERVASFTRRVRGVPDIMDAERIRMHGETYRVSEQYVSRIEFCEGEFTWAPQVDEETLVTEAYSSPYVLAVNRTRNAEGEDEIEFALTERMNPAALLEKFGIEPPPKPPKPVGSRIGGALTAGALTSLALSVVLLVVLSMMSTTLASRNYGSTDGPHVLDFTVNTTERLHSVELHTPVRNDWAYFDVNLTRLADGEEVDLAEVGREVSYYYGGSGEDSWSEGSQTTSIRFHPPEAGDYRVEVLRSELGSHAVEISVSVIEGAISYVWLILTAVGSVALLVARFFLF